jgi:hypothetical protein
MTGMKRSVLATTEQMIAALIPTPLPLPRPQPPPLPTLPVQRSSAGPAIAALDIARLDRSGRVSARSLLDQLGWRPGHRLRIDAIDRALLIWPAASGATLVGARGDLALPAAVRQMCAIDTGDLVVLAADLRCGVLVVHPAATVAQLLTALHPRRTTDGHGG